MEVGARARSAALRPPATVPRCAARRAAPFATPGVRCGPLRRKPLPPPAAAELLQGSSPLVGFERLAAAAPPPLRQALLLHSFVLLDAGGEVWLYDFLPAEPTAPLTAATLLTGGTVPGVARARRLRGREPKHLPPGAAVRSIARLSRCDAPAAAAAFTAAWGPDLSLARRNCRHHTAAIVAALLGAEAAAAEAAAAEAAAAEAAAAEAGVEGA